MNRTLVDLAWVAGFLEGEGCFRSTKNQPTVLTSQVQREPLDRLARLFGGRVRLCKQQGTFKGQDIHKWSAYSRNAAGIMMTLYAFMSPVRKAQIREALTRWRSVRPAYGVRTSCPRGHEYNEKNTYWFHTGRGGMGRNCRACHREKEREKRRAA